MSAPDSPQPDSPQPDSPQPVEVVSEKLRLLGVVEVKVPWEAIYPCIVRGNLSKESYIVPPVKIALSGVPRLEATLEIHTFSDLIFLMMEEYQSSHPTKLECTVSKTLRKPTDPFVLPCGSVWPDPSTEVIKMKGDDVTITSFPLDFVRCFSLLLKIYAVDLSLPPVSALSRRLNEARLRGDPQCDAFLCVEGAELPAHRVVLTTQSQVFTKMFEGSFKEAHDGRIPLKDTTKEAAEAFLEYLYTGDVEDYNDLELELLDMAERYGVDGLKHECRLRLWTVDAPRALRLLASPLVEDMKERFAQIVMDNWNVVSESEKLFIQEMQKEQPLAAYYFLRAASTPPALSFPQTLASPVAVFKRKPRLGRESCEQPEEQPEDQPLLGEPSDWVVADDWAAAGDPGEWAVDGDPGDAGDWGPQDWA